MSDLLANAPPEVGVDRVSALLAAEFGLAGGLVRLTSERDLNLRLETGGRRFVVKFANQAEPRGVTDFQTAALLYLENKGLPVPRVLRSRSGAVAVETEFGLMRVLTYLEGRPMHEVPRSPALGAAMGEMAARVTRGLAGFSHPAADYVLQWDIRRAGALRPMLAFVPEDLRGICAGVLDRFDEEIAPQLAECLWQVVHNDLNPHNVLLDPADTARIAGVLDFGDMVWTARVCDLAVAASYQVDPGDALGSLAGFVAGYARILPLTGVERGLVADLTAVRMVTTLCIASKRAAAYPGNADYILRNVPAARAGLLALTALPRDQVQRAVLDACKGGK